MQQKRSEDCIILVCNGWPGGFCIGHDLLTTTKPLDAFASTNGINDNGQVEYSMPYHKTLTEIKRGQVWQKTKCNNRPIKVERGKKMNLGEREVATITALKHWQSKKKWASNRQQSRPKRKLLFMWNEMNSREGQTFAPAHVGAGCMENEAEQMPLVLVYTQPQNAKTAWWLVAQGGSGVQYFNYRDVRGLGLLIGSKTLRNPAAFIRGRLRIGHDIGKRYYLSVALSGLFATEEHTGFVVDTVVGFKEKRSSHRTKKSWW